MVKFKKEAYKIQLHFSFLNNNTGLCFLPTVSMSSAENNKECPPMSSKDGCPVWLWKHPSRVPGGGGHHSLRIVEWMYIVKLLLKTINVTATMWSDRPDIRRPESPIFSFTPFTFLILWGDIYSLFFSYIVLAYTVSICQYISLCTNRTQYQYNIVLTK